MMFCVIRYKPNIFPYSFFWQYPPFNDDVFLYCLVFRHLVTMLHAFLIFQSLHVPSIKFSTVWLHVWCIELIREFTYTIISGYCQSYFLRGTVLCSQALTFCILLLSLHDHILLSWYSSLHSCEYWQTARKIQQPILNSIYLLSTQQVFV